jgi:hypothetical protein
MPQLRMQCPKTHRTFDSHITLDTFTLVKVWTSTFEAACPHCGETHQVSVRDAYMDTILAPEMLGLDRLSTRIR